MSDQKNGPVDKLRDGNITASIWENTHDGRSIHNVQFQRSYRGADGQMHNASTFGHNDLLRLSKLAERSYERTRELREAQRQEQPTQKRRTRQRDQGRER